MFGDRKVSTAATIARNICSPGVPLCNLQQGGMVMLNKLLQDYEVFSCLVFPDERSFLVIFGTVYATSSIKYFCHANFNHGLKWPKVARGIYLPTLPTIHYTTASIHTCILDFSIDRSDYCFAPSMLGQCELKVASFSGLVVH